MISMWTHWLPPDTPLKAMTRRLPMPALTCSGTAGAIAFMIVSATALPGQKRAMTGAGKIGLARHPFGAKIVIGRVRPLFCGIDAIGLAVEQDRAQRQPDGAVDRAFQRHVDRLVGRSAARCRSRSTWISDPLTVSVASIGRSLAGRIGAVEIAVDMGAGVVDAVRQSRMASRISRSE